MFTDNTVAELKELLQRVKDMGIVKGAESGDTYEAQVAELTSRLSAADAAYIEAQGWDRPENIKYLVSYVTAKIEADIEV